MKRLLPIIMLTAVSLGCTHKMDVNYPNTVSGNFEALWSIIDERYCFVEEKGVDWDEIHSRYEKDLTTIATERELFDLLASMLNELKDGHVNLYSPFDISRSDGWYEGYPDNYNSKLVYGDKYLTKQYKIAGGLYYNLIANGDVGLIRYESFSNGFSDLNMAYVLNYFENCKGLILDVRHNGGGDMDNAFKLASTFFREPRCVGYWNHKTGKGHYDFSNLEELRVDTTSTKATRWTKPVVVLTNRHTYSAANFFVNCMRYADRCTIIGGTTGGGGGMPLGYELPISWTVRFSSVKFYDADKKTIEEGIKPDIEVTLTSSDEDDLIERAIYVNTISESQ